MIGIALEIKTACSSCGNQLAVNALVPAIRCFNCTTVNHFDEKFWKDVLEDVFKEVSGFKENQEKPRKIQRPGSAPIDLTIGRRQPRDPSTRTPVPMENMPNHYTDPGIYRDEDGSYNVYLRRLPEEYMSLFPGVGFLIGEDPDLLPGCGGDPAKSPMPKSANPVALRCPHCGAGLDVDGTARTILCSHCNSSAFLPDNVWQRLHPTKQANCWYMWYDEGGALHKWQELYDAVTDLEGNLYIACSPEHDEDRLLLVSLDGDWKTRWVVKDLNYSAEGSKVPRLALTPDGGVLIWSHGRHSFQVFSTKDGSQKAKGGGKDAFSLSKCSCLECDAEGNLLTIFPLDKGGEYSFELRRYNMKGERLPGWVDPAGRQAKPGFFSKLFGGVAGGDPVSDTGDYPGKFKHEVTNITRGPDGSLYFSDGTNILKYEANGKRVYVLEAPDCWTRVCGDAQGNAYALSEGELSNISPNGKTIKVLGTNIKKGGTLGDENHMAVAGGDAIVMAGYGTCLRLVSVEGKTLKRSAATMESDEYDLKEKDKKEEK